MGYETITWHSAAVLDVDASITATVTSFLDPQKKECKHTQMAWCTPQPVKEADEAVMTENEEVSAYG